MTVETLKQKIEKYRGICKSQNGSVCTFSDNGPVGLHLITALAAVIEAQDARIVALEKRISNLPGPATFQ